MTDLARLVVRLEAQTAQYQKALETATGRLQRFQKDASGLISKVGGAFATYLTVGALISWSTKVLDSAEALANLSEASGVGVESLQKLQYAAMKNGVEAEQLGVALRKLNQTISEAAGNAKSEAAQAFAIMGIKITDASGRLLKADEVLARISDKFATYADGANKVALATATMGRTGDALIPTLNGGSAGLAAFSAELERTGALLSEDTVNAAKEFNDKLTELGTTIGGGLSAKIAEKLLPALNDLADSFTDSAEGAESLEQAAEFAANGLKILFSAAVIVTAIVNAIGRTLGAVAAAIVAVFEGDFDRAGQIIRDNYEDQSRAAENLQKRLKVIWREGGDDQIKEIKITAKRLQQEAPNLAASGVAQQVESGIKAAVQRLRDMNAQLGEQVATFGLGDAAATKYRLTIGSLSDEVAKAGKQGLVLRDSIIQQAQALEQLARAKEVATALGEVNAQIKDLQGNTAEAVLARFDQQNAELVKKLREDGNASGLEQLDTLRGLIEAQARYNLLTEQADRIQQDLADTEERIQNTRRVGAITDLEALQETEAARRKAADQLDAIYQAEKAISDVAGNPMLVDQTNKTAAAIDNLKSQTDLLAQSIESAFEDSASTAIADFVKGTISAGDAISKVLDDLANQLIELAAQNFIQGLFGGTGGGGGIGGFFAGLFGGGRASGGPVHPGMAYRVNENTPRSEWFVPDQSGHIVPSAAMGGGVQVSQHFVIQAPQGTVSRQTQMQVGAEAAKGLARANQRNN